MGKPILETKDLTIRFGGVVAVDRVSISIQAGQIFGLIGPNGAGKTTMFNLLTGVYKPTEGQVLYKGEDITKLKPHEITPLGMSRTFQNIRLLQGHTVFENVLLATHTHTNYGFVQALFQLKKYRQEEQKAIETTRHLIEEYGLADIQEEIASDLPQGLQRKIEIVRAIATGAEFIYLDEPAAGLNPTETSELMDLIRRLNSEGKTIFLIEHDMKLVKGVCNQIAVLNFGQLIDQGTYEQVTANPDVIQAYLGRRHQDAENK